MLCGDVVHAEPGRDHERNQDRHPDIAGVVNKGFRAGRNLADQRARRVLQNQRLTTEDAGGHDQRHQNLHRGDAEIAQPRIHAERITLHPLGVEEGDVGHRGGKVAATDPRQESHRLELPERGVGVLQENARSRRRDDQQRRGQENCVPAAGNPYEEGRWNAQRRAGQPGDRRQREQLGLAEGKAQIDHLDRDDSPVQPHRKSAQQTGNGYPEITRGDSLAFRRPESLVLGVPVR